MWKRGHFRTRNQSGYPIAWIIDQRFAIPIGRIQMPEMHVISLRKKFVGVIGPDKSGKSTVIQSLTGCHDHSFIGFVYDHSVSSKIWVHATSPQEQPPNHQTTEPIYRRYLRRVIQHQDAQGFVIAIRPNLPRRRLSMDRMFQLASQYGFETYAFILDPTYHGQNLGNFNQISNRLLAADPNVQIFKQDGRRFAILTAEAIRAISRLPH
jgi:energy-coupling factor transporter ATP-binding protein EcfA2